MAKRKKKIGRIYKHAKQRRETRKLNQWKPLRVQCDDHNYCAKAQTEESSCIDSQPNLANNDHCEGPAHADQHVLCLNISLHTPSQNVNFPLSPNQTTDNDCSEHPVIAIPYEVLRLNTGPRITSQTVSENRKSSNATLPQTATCNDDDDHVDLVKILKVLKNEEELPHNWSVTVCNSVLQLCMLAPGFYPIIQRWITMNTHRVVAAFVHGKELGRDHAFWGNVCDITGNDCFLIAKQLLSIVKCMHAFTVCCGNFEKAFQNLIDITQVLLPSKMGYVEQNYVEPGYECTIRSAECELFVSKNEKRCVPCIIQRKALQTKLSRTKRQTNSSTSLSRPHSSIPNSLLVPYLKQYSQKATRLRGQLNAYKKRLAKLRQRNGLQFSENVGEDVKKLVQEVCTSQAHH